MTSNQPGCNKSQETPALRVWCEQPAGKHTLTCPCLSASLVEGPDGQLVLPEAPRQAQTWAHPCRARAAHHHHQRLAAAWEGTSSCSCCGSCFYCGHSAACCLRVQAQHPPQGCACSYVACAGCALSHHAAAAAPSPPALILGCRHGFCAFCASCVSYASCAFCASWHQTPLHMQQTGSSSTLL
jgi:hypothetical protein